jgi:5-methylcytosine-specific restriction endonuclease McrA
MKTAQTQLSLSKELRVSIFRRDGWLCWWCKRPVVFAPVMKYLERELRRAGRDEPLAYYHSNWTREGAPLLDELGAVIDHVGPAASDGSYEPQQLVTSCWKCNVRKNSLSTWNQRKRRSPVNSKYGEPQHWDGLSTVFILLTESDPDQLTENEKAWLRALKAGRGRKG